MKYFILFQICLLFAATSINAQYMMPTVPKNGDLKDFQRAINKMMRPDLQNDSKLELPKAFYKSVFKLVDTKPKAPKYKKVVYKFKVSSQDQLKDLKKRYPGVNVGKNGKKLKFKFTIPKSEKQKKIKKMKFKLRIPKKSGNVQKMTVKINGTKIEIPLSAKGLNNHKEMKLKIKVKGNRLKAKLNGKKYLIKDINNTSRRDFVFKGMEKNMFRIARAFGSDEKKFFGGIKIEKIVEEVIQKLIPETTASENLKRIKKRLITKANDKKNIKAVKQAIFTIIPKSETQNLSAVKKAISKIIPKPEIQNLSAVKEALIEIIPAAEKSKNESFSILEDDKQVNAVEI